MAMLAAGVSPVYPCHVEPAQMRTHPIGTGPFEFVEYRQNQRIALKKNEDYWKPDRPHLDGIVYRIISSRSTRLLSFIAGEDDLTLPTDITLQLLTEIPHLPPAAQWQVRGLTVSNPLPVHPEIGKEARRAREGK